MTFLTQYLSHLLHFPYPQGTLTCQRKKFYIIWSW